MGGRFDMARISLTPRILRVAWDRDLEPADLQPMGAAEFIRDVHRHGKAERHLGLHVIGTFGVSLGLLALRCGRSGDTLTPLTASWPDTSIIRIEPAQSNPRRAESDDGA
jgi:hypothetical protein